ncbi:MAG: iron-containing alcohol dehydrogenase [bacterium]
MEIRFGKKLLESLSGRDISGPLALLEDPKYADAVLEKLPAKPALVREPGGLSSESLDEVCAGLEPGTVLAAGGGDIGYAGRYAAWKTGSKLITLPFEISGESLVRRDVITIEEGLFKRHGHHDDELLLVDSECIWKGDERISRAGAGDILGMLIAVEDWRSAEGGSGFSEDVVNQAVEIVDELMDRADELFDLTEGGIRRLVELLHAREKLAESAGHRRMIEGSERIFEECARNVLGKPLSHGPLRCLGVISMAVLHGLSTRPFKQFLHWIQVPWKPEDQGISDTELWKILSSLPAFVKKYEYPDTIIHHVEMGEERINRVMTGIREPFLKSSLQTRND